MPSLGPCASGGKAGKAVIAKVARGKKTLHEAHPVEHQWKRRAAKMAGLTSSLSPTKSGDGLDSSDDESSV
jgi:hypothetical protein